MAFTIDDTMLPATLTWRPMTDDEFADFCSEYRDWFFEMTADAELVIMPPSYTLNGVRNAGIQSQLANWAERDKRGVGTAASASFVLPNGARRSADTAWTAKDRIRQLSKQSLEGFWHLAPDLVIELKTQFERLAMLREKMREWIENGAQLGWMIDPENRLVEVYRPGGEPESFTGTDAIKGEGPVEGFVLDLRPVWDPLGQ